MKTIKINFPGLSQLEVRTQNKDLFYSPTGGWYEDEDFAKEKIPAGEWEVSLEIVPNSVNKTWNEQQELLEKGNEIPPVAVLLYAMAQHFKETGERAFEEVWVRTSSCGSDGNRVNVGFDDDGRLRVSRRWDGRRYSRVGVARARKLEPGTLENLGAFEGSDLTLESLTARVETLEERIDALADWAKSVSSFK